MRPAFAGGFLNPYVHYPMCPLLEGLRAPTTTRHRRNSSLPLGETHRLRDTVAVNFATWFVQRKEAGPWAQPSSRSWISARFATGAASSSAAYARTAFGSFRFTLVRTAASIFRPSLVSKA